MPLNRLEDMYGRDGLELARSTICGWHAMLAELCARSSPRCAKTRSSSPSSAPTRLAFSYQNKERCRTGHFWVIVAPGRRVAFEYTRPHEQCCRRRARRLSRVSRGRCTRRLRPPICERRRRRSELLGALPKVLLQGARLRSRPREGRAQPYRRALPDRANDRRCPRKKKETIRDKRSRPIVEAFFSWCDGEAANVLDDTPISNGIRYARNQREGPRALSQ